VGVCPWLGRQEGPPNGAQHVTALVTTDKAGLDPAVGRLPGSLMAEIDRGLRRLLGR
jgi:hypothetical protein